MMSPDLIASLTVLMNSSSCVAILNDTKCVPMWADTLSKASFVNLLAELPHFIGLLVRNGSTSEVFISAAFSVSITAKKGGSFSPLFSAA